MKIPFIFQKILTCKRCIKYCIITSRGNYKKVIQKQITKAYSVGRYSGIRSYETFKDHIAFGSVLIYDKEKMRKELVEKLERKSITYSLSELKGLADSENPLDSVK